MFGCWEVETVSTPCFNQNTKHQVGFSIVLSITMNHICFVSEVISRSKSLSLRSFVNEE